MKKNKDTDMAKTERLSGSDYRRYIAAINDACIGQGMTAPVTDPGNDDVMVRLDRIDAKLAALTELVEGLVRE